MTLAPAAQPLSPEAELRAFIARFDAKTQKLFRALRGALRQRLPSANELAYDYPDSVVIGYSPTQRGIEAVVALAIRSEGVRLYLSQGPQLPDPQRLLQGSAKQTRFLPIDAAGRLADAAVEALIAAAVAHAAVPLPAQGRGALVIQSSAARRRPRRKASA